MYYSQLRAFHAVATQGGFSKAAEHLHLTQPTLSDQVRKLEKDFDILLFNRTSRSVALTDAGRHLLAITNRMFECEGEALEYLKESQNLLVGSLTLSADAPFHVLRIVRAFRNRYPGVTVNLKIGNSEDILNQLYDFDADVGVFSHVPDDARLKVLSLRDDPLVAVINRDHPWAGRGAVQFKELAGEPLVLRERGSTTRKLVEQEFARLEIQMGTVMEVEGRESIREAVATGNGIGFVSKPEFGFDSRLVMIELKDCKLPMHEYMVCLENRAETRVVRAFWELAMTERD
ncbi:MAG: LysR family transcriptional regulator [Rhodospirillaceae bacterium]|nr:LysR family transcriptional regulator [Rhodospirillaceae bacterium]